MQREKSVGQIHQFLKIKRPVRWRKCKAVWKSNVKRDRKHDPGNAPIEPCINTIPNPISAAISTARKKTILLAGQMVQTKALARVNKDRRPVYKGKKVQLHSFLAA